MSIASLVRVVRFRARHHYGRSDRPEAWNEARFGDQREAHEHVFRLEVTVKGPIDPETGFVVDLARFDALLAEIVGPLEGADLNESIPEVREGTMQPSTEALAGWFRARIACGIPAPATVTTVRLWESDTLAGEVGADE